MQKTLGDRAKTIHFKPVIIKEYKRIYNVFIPSYKCKNAAANIVKIKSPNNYFLNAVMIEINDNELQLLNKREEIYTLKKVDSYDFITGKYLGVALTYLVEPHSIHFKNYIHPRLLDVFLAQSGAYQLSPQFGYIFDKTTFNCYDNLFLL